LDSTLEVKKTVEKTMTFRIPHEKIVATHFFATGWAPDFWTALDFQQLDTQLITIKSMGFNCVIIVVPWCGFSHAHPQQDGYVSHTAYWQLFERLLVVLQQHELYVILRIGYSHDSLTQGQRAAFSPLHTDSDCFVRHMTLTTNRQSWTAWCAFLRQLWQQVEQFPNVLGGFLSWEDFLLLDLTSLSFSERIAFAKTTGFQTYLTARYQLSEVSATYQTEFTNWEAVPIPTADSAAITLLCEFWDDWLVEQIFKPALNHFPALTMEVRVDCERLPDDTFICHARTFDLVPSVPLTFIYYIPAWGNAAEGQRITAANALQRLTELLQFIRTKTDNAIFIDQLIFIDNTPGFEQNAQLIPAEIPLFLQQAQSVLAEYTIGYGLWSLQDVAANALLNSRLEAQWGQWALHKAAYCEAVESCGVLLDTQGYAQQCIANRALILCGDKHFNLDFQAKLLEAGQSALQIAVLDADDNIVMTYDIQLQSTQWQPIKLTEMPFLPYYTLRFSNLGDKVVLGWVYLYQLHQENGIISANGQPKPFFKAMLELNATLNKNVKQDINNNKEDMS